MSRRLTGFSFSELVDLARKIDEQHEVEELSQLLAAVGVTGVDGDLKNIIFAANGPKPRIILRDAINNVGSCDWGAIRCRPFSESPSPWFLPAHAQGYESRAGGALSRFMSFCAFSR